VRAAEAAGVGERVDEDQAALCVGIDHLDGLAGHAGDDIAGALGAAAGHILDGGDQGRHRHCRLELRDGLHGAEHGGAAAHVVLHFLHAIGGLDGNTAGVEGDAFPDQAEVILGSGLAGRAVAQNDEGWRLVATLGDAQQGAHAEFPHLVLIESLALQAE